MARHDVFDGLKHNFMAGFGNADVFAVVSEDDGKLASNMDRRAVEQCLASLSIKKIRWFDGRHSRTKTATITLERSSSRSGVNA
jgi:hypothetical protein